MSEMIWQEIATTPWWIYVGLVYLAHLAIQATRSRVFHIAMFRMNATFFISLSISCMCARLDQVNVAIFSQWATMVILGTGLGYLHFAYMQVRAIESTPNIYLPPTLLPVVAFIIGIGIKFYFHYSLHFSLYEIIVPPNFTMFLALYGLTTGMCVGRYSFVIACVKKGPKISSTLVAAAE